MAYQEEYMRLAIELAGRGIGGVNPNPLVGAVVVKDGRIIGQGYHARYGELHAERAALASLSEPAEGAELYVTLEPCCHQGKQPPCVEAIAEHGISKVYVGSDDPNEKVAGKGIRYLREHGIEVDTHCLKDECDAVNPVFFHYITTKTPYVALKYAMTMDGKIAAYTGESKWISNETSRRRVQEMRNAYMGIMTGIGTVLSDDPMLTCRISGGRNPVRIICDTNFRIPYESNIVQSAKDVKTIVAIGELPADEGEGLRQRLTDKVHRVKMDKMRKLEEMGLDILPVRRKNGMLDLQALMCKLGERGIDGILLEGGGSLNYGALTAGIVQEVFLFLAPKILGGRDALTPVEGQGFPKPDLAKLFSVQSIEQLEDDILVRYRRA